MGYTIAQKIIKAHLLSGEMTVGSDIGLKIDQTLTQDATGTMAYLEFEAMGVPSGYQKTRHLLFPSGQRHLPPSTFGTFWYSGKNINRF